MRAMAFAWGVERSGVRLRAETKRPYSSRESWPAVKIGSGSVLQNERASKCEMWVSIHLQSKCGYPSGPLASYV